MGKEAVLCRCDIRSMCWTHWRKKAITPIRSEQRDYSASPPCRSSATNRAYLGKTLKPCADFWTVSPQILLSMCERLMSAKGADFFRGQISSVFRPLGDGFCPSRSVVETMCLIGHPRHPFREEKLSASRSRYGVANTPTEWPFCFERRFSWLFAAESAQSRLTAINDKNGESSIVNFSPFPYFQPSKISSMAYVIATSAKLSIKLNISFSNNDCSRCFFFLSFCFFRWVCLKEE